MCTTAAIGRASPLLRCLAVVLVLVLLSGGAARAQATTPAPDAPPQVKALLQLLSDPAVQHWLDQQRAAEAKPAAPAEPAAAPATPANLVDQRLAAFKAHITGLAAAVPTLPGQFVLARDRLLDEFHQSRKFRPLVLILAFIAIGFGVEWLFWRATAGARRRIAEQRLDTIPRRLIGV